MSMVICHFLDTNANMTIILVKTKESESLQLSTNVCLRSAHVTGRINFLILWHLEQIVISQLDRKCWFGPSYVLKGTRGKMYASTPKSKMRKHQYAYTIHCGCVVGDGEKLLRTIFLTVFSIVDLYSFSLHLTMKVTNGSPLNNTKSKHFTLLAEY